MSDIYNERKKQLADDAKRAASISPTAFVPVPGGEVFDYGEHAGIGSSELRPRPARIEAGVKRGREAEFMAFLLAQTDDHSRRLATFAQRERREFTRALAEWVREWDAAGLMIPDCVDWQRKAA